MLATRSPVETSTLNIRSPLPHAPAGAAAPAPPSAQPTGLFGKRERGGDQPRPQRYVGHTVSSGDLNAQHTLPSPPTPRQGLPPLHPLGVCPLGGILAEQRCFEHVQPFQANAKYA